MKSLGCLGEEQQRIKSRHLQHSDLRPPPLTLPRAASPGLVAHLSAPGKAAWWDARAGVGGGAIQGSRWLLIIYNLHQVIYIYKKISFYLYICTYIYNLHLPCLSFPPCEDDAISLSTVLYKHLHTRQYYCH